MYDPARDTFTLSTAGPVSDEPSADPSEAPSEAVPQTKPVPKENGTTTNENPQPPVYSPSQPALNSESRCSNPSPLPKSRKRAASRSPSPHKRTKLAPPRSSPSGREQRPSQPKRSPVAPKHQPNAYLRRSPPPKPRSPTPPPRSPPRQRKRPGAASRIATAEKEALRTRQTEREAEQLSSAQAAAATRGVHDVVRQHYNAVPQRGRDWRQTGSRIKGLRNYNNWVKSTLIQKFSPSEAFVAGSGGNAGLLVLDIGCGKGGDLGKWAKAPQAVELYVGVDPAEVSIEQARSRYAEMRGRGGRGGAVFQGDFYVKDGYGEWIGDIPVVREVGIDGSVGPGGSGSARWGGGGFDVVTMMFCMHYAFESEAKARGMLRNVAGALKKGGRFIGVIPNSDVLRTKVEEFHKGQAAKTVNGHAAAGDNKESASKAEENSEVSDLAVPEWGNSLYRVRFPGKTPEDGIFRPPFGWKYSYFMEEAVEEVPEYVVPWEAFRALAEDYNLELQYRKPFAEIWKEEKDDAVLGPLSVRMGVRQGAEGPLLLTEEELEAVGFYHAFCFYKV